MKKINLLLILSLLLNARFLSSCQTKSQTDKKNQEHNPYYKGTINIDGSELSYVVEGTGLPCLVIGSSIYYPKTFSKELREHLQLYFVDLKWFAKGYKKENLDEVDITSIVQDIEQIRQELGLVKPVMIGHSIHGTIAMEYVKAHEDKVSGLVVIGSPAAWGNELYEKKAADLWATASKERRELQETNWGNTKEIDRLTGQEEASARYNNMSPQYWYDPYYDAAWLWDSMTVHSELTTHLFTKVFKEYNMFEPAIEVNIPVFVGLGKFDYVIPFTLWKDQYDNIQDFTLIHFEKSGHTPQLEEPVLFNKNLLAWINKKIN